MQQMQPPVWWPPMPMVYGADDGSFGRRRRGPRPQTTCAHCGHWIFTDRIPKNPCCECGCPFPVVDSSANVQRTFGSYLEAAQSAQRSPQRPRQTQHVIVPSQEPAANTALEELCSSFAGAWSTVLADDEKKEQVGSLFGPDFSNKLVSFVSAFETYKAARDPKPAAAAPKPADVLAETRKAHQAAQEAHSRVEKANAKVKERVRRIEADLAAARADLRKSDAALVEASTTLDQAYTAMRKAREQHTVTAGTGADATLDDLGGDAYISDAEFVDEQMGCGVPTDLATAVKRLHMWEAREHNRITRRKQHGGATLAQAQLAAAEQLRAAEAAVAAAALAQEQLRAAEVARAAAENAGREAGAPSAAGAGVALG